MDYPQVSQDLRHECRSSYNVKGGHAKKSVSGITQSAESKQDSEVTPFPPRFFFFEEDNRECER